MGIRKACYPRLERQVANMRIPLCSACFSHHSVPSPTDASPLVAAGASTPTSSQPRSPMALLAFEPHASAELKVSTAAAKPGQELGSIALTSSGDLGYPRQRRRPTSADPVYEVVDTPEPRRRPSSGSLGKRRSSARQDSFARAASVERYSGPERSVPSIGGCVSLRAPHSAHLLPLEVALFEPSDEEIFHGGCVLGHVGARQIFLNTPLSGREASALRKFREALGGEVPEYARPHALRLLQQSKFDMAKALELLRTLLTERVRRLPIAEIDVLEDLRSGFIYWHGRDRKCRPCMVIRLERLGVMARDRERVVRLVVFVLEYALRFAMVPGRVENWVVILDLANALKVISPFHLGSTLSTAIALGTTLERVYCGRMVWMKIVNMPGNNFVNKAVNSAVPSEKRDKVSFPADAAAAMLEHFEANQLEARYGGTAPDLEPEETYPFHFFPNATGTRKASSVEQDGDTSLHHLTSHAFHEGCLWDTSCSDAARARWLRKAKASSLPPRAAAELSRLSGSIVEPCRDEIRLRQLLERAVPEAEEDAEGSANVLPISRPSRRRTSRDACAESHAADPSVAPAVAAV
eukprot:TRINITY_DN25404_c0_g1_i1.p1 TRINITY_DN25404_c0_g1~~TRINITY_DN25404_c0_g1_i1.p1  ORF type:complete len:581 (-),score=107.69 TRINITY_DN25404_c0_g1_i1:234-1976(-)